MTMGAMTAAEMKTALQAHYAHQQATRRSIEQAPTVADGIRAAVAALVSRAGYTDVTAAMDPVLAGLLRLAEQAVAREP